MPGGLSAVVLSIATAETIGGSHSPQSSAQLTQVSIPSQTASPQISSAPALLLKHHTHTIDTFKNLHHLFIAYLHFRNAAS